MREITYPRVSDTAKAFIFEMQEFFQFLFRVVTNLKRLPRYRSDLFDYMDIIGFESLPIVLLGGSFVGVILVLEAMSELEVYGAQVLLGKVTGVTIVRGLAPVMTSMLVASRACSGAATELGAMRISQQLDALQTMGMQPVGKLITPRVVAATVMFPILTVALATAAIVSSALITWQADSTPPAFFVRQSLSMVHIGDMTWGLTKAAVIGGVVVLVACHFGVRTSGGASGIRRATTGAVVAGMLLTLGVDFLLTTFIHSF